MTTEDKVVPLESISFAGKFMKNGSLALPMVGQKQNHTARSGGSISYGPAGRDSYGPGGANSYGPGEEKNVTNPWKVGK